MLQHPADLSVRKGMTGFPESRRLMESTHNYLEDPDEDLDDEFDWRPRMPRAHLRFRGTRSNATVANRAGKRWHQPRLRRAYDRHLRWPRSNASGFRRRALCRC